MPTECTNAAPGTRKILHAAEHLVLLRRGSHQQRPRLPLARLERSTRVTHLAGHLQCVEPGQRFVDHHWPQLRRLEHGVLPIGSQVARGGLLDVLHQIECLRARSSQLMLELQQVLHVGASFVEIERVDPVRENRASPAPQ